MLLLAFAASSALQITPVPAPSQARCPEPYARTAADRGPMRSRKLGKLPPGRAILAVNKSVGGCAVSVLMERGPDGERLMRPEAAGVSRTPTSEPQRRLQGGR